LTDNTGVQAGESFSDTKTQAAEQNAALWFGSFLLLGSATVVSSVR
jgi:hypothetical protein